MTGVDISYRPAGPVAAAFHGDKSFVRGLKGPIGSGKSTACCMDIMSHALRQPKGSDGVARGRAIIVRNDYPQLKSTTIKTWLEWFPEELFGKVRWDAPITQTMALGDDRYLEVLFLAMDRPDDVRKVLSLDTSWVWLNEVRELPFEVLTAVTGRVGRYPPPKYGVGCFHKCVIMDTNPPSDDHWYHRLAEEERPEGWAFFDQPGGMEPDAENLDFLNQTTETLALPVGDPVRREQGRQYYVNLLSGKPRTWIDVYIHAKYGATHSGRPVYPEFNADVHVAREPLAPARGLPLYLGFDLGLTPACVIAQHTSDGQLRVLDEVVGNGVGLGKFLDTKVSPLLAAKYPGMALMSPFDPAGNQRAQTDETTCRQVLAERGFNPKQVSTNSFVARRESTAWFLSRLVGGVPAMTVSPTCKQFIKALSGAYVFERVNVPGEDRYKDVPKKNMASHVAEAGQYLTLYFHTPGRKRADPPAARGAYKPSQTAGY